MQFRITKTICMLYLATSALADDKATLRREFLSATPGAKFHRTQHRVTTVYATTFGGGRDPIVAAGRFVDEHAAMFGLAPADLRAANARGGIVTQPVMYDAASRSYKFTLVYYRQFFEDVPVYRCEMRLLVRNEAGHPLVLARTDVRDLGGFSIDPNIPTLGREQLELMAAAEVPGLSNFSAPRTVIWAGVDAVLDEPTLAVEMIGDNRGASNRVEEKWLFVMDAITGELLHVEDQMLRFSGEISGTTEVKATPDFDSSACNTTLEVRALPYARIDVDGVLAAYADALGQFSIDHAGTDPVTVTSHLSGKWFTVKDDEDGGAHETVALPLTPPGTVSFLHNDPGNGEFTTAQANAYIHANLARDFALAANPLYPTIGVQEGFEILVNSSSPGGLYDGERIRFQKAGGILSNFAFGTIVHHEYGHHLVQVAGSGQRSYGEGMADAMGVLITHQPKMGVGRFIPPNCSAESRSADNSCQYHPVECTDCPNGQVPHVCGTVLSGCVWHTREALRTATPPVPGYDDIVRDLAVNAILLHTGSTIDPSIYIDWLILDDDNGNLLDGTPHGDQIYAGFDAHSMVPDGLIDGAGEIYTWTGQGSNQNFDDPCNWSSEDPDYPQNAGDAAFIDGATTEDVYLTSETIRKLALSRDVDFFAAAGTPTLQVKAFTLFAPDADIEITISAASISQPPAP